MDTQEDAIVSVDDEQEYLQNYEMRRKAQNRLAQRRYRQRIKQKQEAEKNKAVKSMNRNGPAAARPTINCSCQSSSGHSSSQCEGSNEQELQNPMPWNDEDPGALFHSLAWPRHPPAEVGGAASYDDRNEMPNYRPNADDRVCLSPEQLEDDLNLVDAHVALAIQMAGSVMDESSESDQGNHMSMTGLYFSSPFEPRMDSMDSHARPKSGSVNNRHQDLDAGLSSQMHRQRPESEGLTGWGPPKPPLTKSSYLPKAQGHKHLTHRSCAKTPANNLSNMSSTSQYECRLKNKASNMVGELQQLYKLGVDLGMLRYDAGLVDNMRNIRQRFVALSIPTNMDGRSRGQMAGIDDESDAISSMESIPVDCCHTPSDCNDKSSGDSVCRDGGSSLEESDPSEGGRGHFCGAYRGSQQARFIPTGNSQHDQMRRAVHMTSAQTLNGNRPSERQFNNRGTKRMR